MEYTKEQLEIICDALKTRYQELNKIEREGISSKIRQVAKEETKEVGTLWGQVEQDLIAKSKV